MSNAGPISGGAPGGAYLLDTSVLIRSLRGDVAMSARINAATQIYVSSVVLGELYFGAFGSPSRSGPALIEVEQIERTLAVLPVDAVTARIFGQIKQELKRAGYIMPDNDLWIAATAIQYDVTLAARDAHFDWVMGLRVEQW